MKYRSTTVSVLNRFCLQYSTVLVLYSTVLFSLVTSLLVTRGLKKECDYGYPIGNKQVGVLPYFVNINW